MSGAKSAEELYAWLRSAAGLETEVLHEAKAALRAEQVFSVADLRVLQQEGALRDVFTARVTARKVADALAAQPAQHASSPTSARPREVLEAVRRSIDFDALAAPLGLAPEPAAQQAGAAVLLQAALRGLLARRAARRCAARRRKRHFVAKLHAAAEQREAGVARANPEAAAMAAAVAWEERSRAAAAAAEAAGGGASLCMNCLEGVMGPTAVFCDPCYELGTADRADDGMRREERFAAARDMVALLRAEAARLQASAAAERAEEQGRYARGADGAELESERGGTTYRATTIAPLRPASRETKAPPPSAPSSTPSSAPSAAPPAKTLKAKKAAAAAAAAAEAEYERLRRRAPLRCAPGGGWDLLEFFGRGGWDEEGLAEAHYQLDLDEAYGEEEEVFPGFDGDGMEEGFSRPPPDAYSDIMQSMLFDSRDENMFFDWLGEGDEDWTGA